MKRAKQSDGKTYSWQAVFKGEGHQHPEVDAHELVADDNDRLSPLGLKRGKRSWEVAGVMDSYQLKSNAQGLATSLGLAKSSCQRATWRSSVLYTAQRPR